MPRILKTWTLALAGALAAMAAIPASAAEMKTYQFFVRNQPAEGREAEYNDFYDKAHAPDVVSIPGFVNGQRAVLSDQQLIPGSNVARVPKYLVVYTIRTDDLPALKAEIAKRLANGQTRTSDSMSREGGSSFYYEVYQPALTVPLRTPPGAKAGPMQTYLHLVFTVPAAGREDEFNTWYDTHHSPDMLKTPGIVAAQRERLADPGRFPPPSNYIAMFTLKTSDMEALAKKFAEDRPARTPGTSMTAGIGYTYRLIGPELNGDAIRKARAAAAKK